MKTKVILFGGTFDPVHCGHVIVAEFSLKHLNADRLIFIPAKRSPHKQLLPKAPDQARIDMIALAIAKKQEFSVSDCELKMPQPSYTLNTVRHFRNLFGDSTIISVLLGADTVKDLAKWYRIKDLIKECEICIMYRAGFEPPRFEHLRTLLGDDNVEKLQKNLIKTPLIDISGTEIRKKLAENLETEGMIDNDVREYINKNRLYSPPI